MHIKKVEDREENIWFEDKDGKKKFTRIVGGLGWPGVNLGFALVVAENFDEDPFLKIRHLRVLAEAENKSLETLFQKCLDLRERYCVQNFYANTEDKSMMELLYYYNQDLKDISSLSLCLASFPEDLGYHMRIVEEYLVKGKRILQFEEESILPSYLLELSPEEALRGSIYDFPAVAALGYAVSYFKSHPWRKKVRPRRRSEETWKTV